MVCFSICLDLLCFVSSVFCNFHHRNPALFFFYLREIYKYFILWSIIIFQISVSNSSLLVYRNSVEFFVCKRVPYNLAKLTSQFQECLLNSVGFSTWTSRSSVRRTALFHSFLSLCLLFIYLFICIITLARISNIMLIGIVRVYLLALFSNLGEKAFSLSPIILTIGFFCVWGGPLSG